MAILAHGVSSFCRRISLALVLAAVGATSAHGATNEYDIVVYGGSPAGLMAAVAAAHEGASVVVVEPSRWIGGLVAGGLSKTDHGRQETIGGLARQFFSQAAARYAGKHLWFAEPHANMETFDAMIREAKVDVVKESRLKSVARKGPRIESLTTEAGKTFTGKVFIDASYEGDLMARAGVAYVVGRESQKTYGEDLAGVRREKVRDFPMDVMTQGCICVGGKGPHYVHGAPTKIAARDAQGKLLWGISESSAKPGTADALTQSYNFRLAVTRRPDLLVPWPKPQAYDPARYELLLKLIQAYPGIPFTRLVHMGDIANGKYDLNAQGLFSTDYVAGNFRYPDADSAERKRICDDHVAYVQGFCWFLAHDERLSQTLRDEVNSWGLCRDEFPDNGGWPYALYVREARRMIGEYVMRQSDVQKQITKPDSVAMGSFIIDSHIVQRVVDTDGTIIDEGAFDAPTRPYQIAYRSITPKRAECENLLVPVCISASHVAYGSIRMEPVYMALGHAAGVAAALVKGDSRAVQDVDISSLQAKLREAKQVLALAGAEDILASSKLPGIVVDDEQAKFTGTWTVTTYGVSVDGASRHDMNFGKGTKTARFALTVPEAGQYELRLCYSHAPNRATNVPVRIESADGSQTVRVNERLAPPIEKLYVSLGTYRLTPDKPAVITISNDNTDGYVVADAVQALRQPR